MLFLQQIEQQLATLLNKKNEVIALQSPYFKQRSATVEQFVAEIRQTAKKLSTQQHTEYAQIYATKLLCQFSTLQNALSHLAVEAKLPNSFRTSFSFSKNIHTLPPAKRLWEYRKALRALNEKLSWLVEQHYRATEPVQKARYLQEITETEYRKQKCLVAIEELGG
ncbi:restart primosome assembly protein PriC [Nicoletella semolina]|uniref:Restart primosome assembly protein PriC n=1 Tax=Nicoletella semolina TaxID=271160 RepID=A0A4R2N9A8_9PAST|nr:primosomal replication protein PriC [Nicoletella semolina]MDH2925507.1 hypothetical protein [Nicoletella semolina]TCP17582.1 restart primosome assembly protein PriC [Nicoletella semolina]